MRVWITGADGLIGNYLAGGVPGARGAYTAGPAAPGVTPIPLTRAQLELSDFGAVHRQFEKDRPDAVIHCAALSSSPECQADPGRARLLNVEVTRMLADLAHGIRFVFFSSDLVFDGRKGGYRETDAVNPLSVYAATKVEAEQIVLRNPGHTVVRTSLNGGRSPTGDRGFNEQMRQAWRAGQTLRLFTDEFRTPIPAEVTARATWELLLRGRTGLFHVAGAQRLSRYELGKLLASATPADDTAARFEAVSLTSYEGAPRPPDTSLNCAKAQSVLSFSLPAVEDWITAHPGSF